MSSSSKKNQKYLHLTPLQDVLREYLKIFSGLYPLSEEIVDVRNSLGRVTAHQVQARMSSPFYRASAMDGYAVHSEQISDADENHPIALKMGNDAIPVDTGDPIPTGYDAVIMIEEAGESGEDTIEIIKSAPPGHHIRESGEDIVVTDMLLPSGHVIRPQDIGFMIAAGILRLPVRKRPVAGIIPTGDEIVSPDEAHHRPMRDGTIIDSNSSMLKALCEDYGATAHITNIIPDNEAELEEAVRNEVRRDDIVMVIAGSSAGRDDFTSTVLNRIGRIYAHGIAIAPGKPTVLSSIDGKPCIGMPGYPVSSLIVAEYLVRPLIHLMLGLPPPMRVSKKAVLASPLPSKLGAEEFVRVGLGQMGDTLLAVPLPKSAGSLTSYVRADGIVRIPRLSEGIPEGTEINVDVIAPKQLCENTIIHQGSHDLCMSILVDILWREYGIKLSSFNVGSIGGLYALKKGHTHIAGCHLLDPATGSYNAWALKKFIPDVPVTIVHLAFREQGLMVAKGNPLTIKGIEDLSDEKVRFVNRQKDSGTRVLFDFLLQKAGIRSDDILGYASQEYTHLGVAHRIHEGSADAGLGLRASAEAFGLDFIPLAREDYDVIMPVSLLSDERIQAFISIAKREDFRQRVVKLGGYDPSESGDVH